MGLCKKRCNFVSNFNEFTHVIAKKEKNCFAIKLSDGARGWSGFVKVQQTYSANLNISKRTTLHF